MSFTQDELDAFNTILEQKLALHRRELELSLDQRMSTLRQEFEQYFANQQDLLHNLSLKLAEQQDEAQDGVNQRLEPYQTTRVIEEVEQGNAEITEMQAEIAWDDLMEVIDKVVENRLSSLEESIQTLVKSTEHTLLTRLQSLRGDLLQVRQGCSDPLTTDVTPMQDVFTSVEQLEHLLEALQVTMTANHTLLSNRLYQHQHQPLERAHPTESTSNENNVPGEDEDN